MKILKRVLLGILSFIVFFLVIITSLFVINQNTGKMTYILGYTAFFNTGTSMNPNINPGDLIIVKKSNKYDVNDIISFISTDNYVTTHRIVDITNTGYVTKGDSNNYTDHSNVTIGNIYGKVVLVIPGITNILSFIWTYKYLILLIIVLIPIVFIIRGKLCMQK